MKIEDVMSPEQLAKVLSKERELFRKMPPTKAVELIFQGLPEEFVSDAYVDVLMKYTPHFHGSGMYRMLMYISYFLQKLDAVEKPN